LKEATDLLGSLLSVALDLYLIIITSYRIQYKEGQLEEGTRLSSRRLSIALAPPASGIQSRDNEADD
jgi:hypothetical protein